MNTKVCLSKKYRTKTGLPVVIYATDVKSTYPVVGKVTFPDGAERVYLYDKWGDPQPHVVSSYCLEEVGQYDHLVKDQAVYVWASNKSHAIKRHFAHTIGSDVYVYLAGKTSFTTTETMRHPNCMEAEEYEASMGVGDCHAF